MLRFFRCVGEGPAILRWEGPIVDTGYDVAKQYNMPLDNLEKPPTPEQDARDRRAANIFLLVAGIVLVGVGVWLANAMIDARRADDCMSSGRRNCNPIEAPQR
jgi:hypothetical protein